MLDLLEAALQQNQWFASIDDESKREQILEHFRAIPYRKGEAVCKQGDVADELFVVQSGIVDVYLHNKRDDKDVKVASLYPGQCFGEASLLYEYPRTSTIIGEFSAPGFEVGISVYIFSSFFSFFAA
jgi:CRP-like cAMP-binding protein